MLELNLSALTALDAGVRRQWEQQGLGKDGGDHWLLTSGQPSVMWR